MSEEKSKDSTKHYCLPCGYIYDPAQGDPEGGVPSGTSFEDINEEVWICPVCGAGKDLFEPLD